jgi:PAS domain-containing protein
MNHGAFTQLLVAADTLDAANRLISGLRSNGVAVRSASTGSEHELAALLAQRQWDVLVCYPSERLSLATVLAALLRADAELPVLCVGAQTQLAVRETIMPDEHERLLAAVRREAEISQLRRQVQQLELRQRELEKRHAVLMDGSSSPISYVQDGVHLACNPSYARCFGYD